ncbi:alpha/beta hydrolase [Microbacter sp. GSS18]|nr:alpha/beta hydrolase [Microbacter sp. GSS18]
MTSPEPAPQPTSDRLKVRPAARPLAWIARLVAVVAVGVVAWALITSWGAVVYGHPAYLVLLAVTAVGAIATLTVSFVRPARPGRWRVIGRVALVVGGSAWVALTAWLRPYSAVEPALAAMMSDAEVTVTASATDIVLAPTAGAGTTGVFFQPGALVDPRAYAAVLRPLVEDGHTVVIAKQPLGIAFLALGAFDAARESNPEIDAWIVGGHSLGGTVAAIEAADDAGAAAPAAGLMFFASYPAGDLSTELTIPVISISGTEDGLSTPADIEASRADLPADATFTVVEGASHAQFGDYGPQSGDGTPTISDAHARYEITAAALGFVAANSD